MVEELITDLGTWKTTLKKNTFRKWYRKSSPGAERSEVVDMFCASWATVNYTLVGLDDLGEGSYKFMVAGNALAEGLASQMENHENGWKLHKDWFKCMVAQLSVDAANERDCGQWNSDRQEYKRTMTTLNALFESLGWDLKSAVSPKAGELTKVTKVYYNYIDRKSGVDEKRCYHILLEPTSPIPIHSVYLARSGKKWAVVSLSPDGGIKLCHQAEDGERELSMILSLTPAQIYGMERLI